MMYVSQSMDSQSLKFGLRLKVVFQPTNQKAKSLPSLEHIQIPISFADLKKEMLKNTV